MSAQGGEATSSQHPRLRRFNSTPCRSLSIPEAGPNAVASLVSARAEQKDEQAGATEPATPADVHSDASESQETKSLYSIKSISKFIIKSCQALFTPVNLVMVPVTVIALVWAIKSYNQTQMEACRQHPNNEFLQSTDLCIKMRLRHDYDSTPAIDISKPDTNNAENNTDENSVDERIQSCSIEEETCDGFCIPKGKTCCGSGYCSDFQICNTEQLCVGCRTDEQECNGFCIKSDRICCGSGYCDSAQTCTDGRCVGCENDQQSCNGFCISKDQICCGSGYCESSQTCNADQRCVGCEIDEEECNGLCMPKGKVCCGSGHCSEGNTCTSNHVCCGSDEEECNGGCMLKGNVCCGSISCDKGQTCQDGICGGCGIGQAECNSMCIPQGTVCCGSGYCQEDQVCTTNSTCCASGMEDCNGLCMPKGKVCCGSGHCEEGQKERLVADLHGAIQIRIAPHKEDVRVVDGQSGADGR
ncbi:hypothetical protein EDB81DRAFT_791044 [Dactylonectria macrodidyma]|uniref:Uncharacterized protein n=1 Tax=Dactylonectria macrodidyma TaxID=307937 RepID=A0A9P9F5N7_9HYPO|nr:hypothetical protein EDB81DRAFT_791044 [Dactylonectria macrodidyma]